ncbi:hypothetical protein J5N97_007356 [Dioscorea zingiberensis]|uniref:Uncharacterized protein n=1 Tax=Dioscorea zingiberensis TaxID=325984 RepID=A0A9D5DC47_9LILI|nr:hypothetical protein J5N97_007356 [Dioscorea zingiberensis]
MVCFQALLNALVAFLVITKGRAEKSKMVVKETDDGMLCISECTTCPAICSPPSSSTTSPPPPPSLQPPPPQVHVVHQSPPPPSSPPKATTHSSPPPPFNYLIITSAPPPPNGEQKGGSSNPYYYFYTSNAWTSALSMSCLLKLVAWVVMSLFVFLQ